MRLLINALSWIPLACLVALGCSSDPESGGGGTALKLAGDACEATSECRQTDEVQLECRCDGQGGEPSCQPRARAGESCAHVDVTSCRDELRCLLVDGKPATCYEIREQGEPCGSSEECAEGLKCDWTDKVCVTTEAQIGDACGRDIDCALPNICHRNLGTCTPPSRVGGDCGVSFGRSLCVPEAYCGPGFRCAAKLALAEACGYDDQCSSGYCTDGRCDTKPGREHLLGCEPVERD